MTSIARRDRSVNRSRVLRAAAGSQRATSGIRSRSTATLAYDRDSAEFFPHTGFSAELHRANAQLHNQRNASKQPPKQGNGWLSPLAALQTADHRPQTAEKPSAVSRQRSAVNPPSHIKLYPSIATAMLKQSKASAGRIWLLARHLDGAGRGWLHVDKLRAQLTKGKRSDSYNVCGWRRLRILLREGEGVFWVRDGAGRVWLRSAEKVAASLEVARLSGIPVALPVSALLGGMHSVRANLYASFHSGRRSDNPISRATLGDLTGASERAQRNYDATAGVKRTKNIAVGGLATAKNIEGSAYKHGRAFFHLKDKCGKHGAAGKSYVAWRLPNQYAGPHDQLARGRQRKINKTLNHRDLVTIRARGNTTGNVGVGRVFFADGARRALAAKTGSDRYWFDVQAKVWRVLSIE